MCNKMIEMAGICPQVLTTLIVVTGLVLTIIVTVYSIEYPPDFGPNLCDESKNFNVNFDIIICGAGSAGSVLASRLSEETSWNVLLLEYGQDAPVNSSFPFLWGTLLNSEVDYRYVTESNGKYFQGLQQKRAAISRGKMSGGSSSMNTAIYLTGTEKDFSQWKNELGCDGWNYEDVLPYMKKAENFHDSERFNSEIHNNEGYLDVSPFYSPDPLIEVFGKALKQSGLKEINDLNADKGIGFGTVDSTTIHGLRCSTARGYLSPASLRRNLFFARRTLVKRVVLDESSVKAIGVEITAPNGNTCIVQARTEVILSLGAIASPQVLLLSGIGPKDHLEEIGVPVKKNLQVGQGLQDHVCFIGVVLSDRKHRNDSVITMESRNLLVQTLKLANQGMSTLGLTQLQAFINTDSDSDKEPNVQLAKMRISRGTMREPINGHHRLTNMFGLSKETAQLFTEINDLSDTVFFMVILTDPISKGFVQLKNANVRDQPMILTNMLHEQQDVDALLKGIKFVRKLAKSSIYTEYGLIEERVNYAACVNFDIESDEYWRCAIEQIATGFYHPTSSVRMGSDQDAVLTTNLTVKGIDNLRVIDASSFPKLISRNTNPTVIMMAEKAADIIKNHHGKLTNYQNQLKPKYQ